MKKCILVSELDFCFRFAILAFIEKNNLIQNCNFKKKMRSVSHFFSILHQRKIMYLKSRIKWPNLLLNEWFNLMSCLHHVLGKTLNCKNSYWPVKGQMDFSRTQILPNLTYIHTTILITLFSHPKTTLALLGYYFIVTWYYT